MVERVEPKRWHARTLFACIGMVFSGALIGFWLRRGGFSPIVLTVTLLCALGLQLGIGKRASP
jgi:hypothetical protein